MGRFLSELFSEYSELLKNKFKKSIDIFHLLPLGPKKPLFHSFESPGSRSGQIAKSLQIPYLNNKRILNGLVENKVITKAWHWRWYKLCHWKIRLLKGQENVQAHR